MRKIISMLNIWKKKNPEQHVIMLLSAFNNTYRGTINLIKDSSTEERLSIGKPFPIDPIDAAVFSLQVCVSGYLLSSPSKSMFEGVVPVFLEKATSKFIDEAGEDDDTWLSDNEEGVAKKYFQDSAGYHTEFMKFFSDKSDDSQRIDAAQTISLMLGTATFGEDEVEEIMNFSMCSMRLAQLYLEAAEYIQRNS